MKSFILNALPKQQWEEGVSGVAWEQISATELSLWITCLHLQCLLDVFIRLFLF